MHQVPLPPYPNQVPLWPLNKYSTLSSGKMVQFIQGHVKYFTKGKTKQEDVEQKNREELIEYNVARRLRESELLDVRNHMIHMTMRRAALGNEID